MDALHVIVICGYFPNQMENPASLGKRTPEALNALAMAHIGLADSQAALDAYDESLSIKPGQDAIEKSVRALRQKLASASQE